MDTRGLLARWRDRVRAAWPAIEERLLAEGGLRSILILIIAIGQGARADSLLDAAAPALAAIMQMVALVLPPPTSGAGRARSFVVARLSEPGTLRSLGAVLLAAQSGASAASIADGLEALAIVVLGAYSAARPAKAVR